MKKHFEFFNSQTVGSKKKTILNDPHAVIYLSRVLAQGVISKDNI